MLILRLILLSWVVVHPLWVGACLSHEAVQASGESFESQILFFKTDEHLVIQQHLTYHEGRPYFNFSLCMKDQHLGGFRLEDAADYDFAQHCEMLGSWLPVFDPEGRDLVNGLFAYKLEGHLTSFIGELEKRSQLAPLIDSFRGLFSEYHNWLLLTASAVVIKQAYQLAPLANNFGPRGSQLRGTGLRAGGFLAVLAIFGLYNQTRERQESVRVHREKLQEVEMIIDRLDREISLLQNQELHLTQNYQLPSPVLSILLESLARSLAEIEMNSPEVCEPMVPEHLRGFILRT